MTYTIYRTCSKGHRNYARVICKWCEEIEWLVIGDER